jgi:formiminoglutamate deiminase
VNSYWCEAAWLGRGQVEPGILIDTADGFVSAVVAGVAAPPPGAKRLTGLTLPGFANAHSHAFHRALRGRTQAGAGTFWTWREQMYEVARRLDPDACYALARATYGEMALSGVSAVGEFHYLHHQPDGTPYVNLNAMGEAILAAAADVGIRITLLDSCYLHGGLSADGYLPLGEDQRRFGDGSVDGWAQRVEGLRSGPLAQIGAAVHSVRAVDPVAIAEVAAWAEGREAPLHVHLSEQPTENEQCAASHDCSPTGLLAGLGVLREGLTAVHGTHLTPADVGLLGAAGVGVCMCPTTERDLADGIGPSGALAAAGSPLSLGSDSHAVIDMFEEARAVELDERLASLERGTHGVDDLLAMATVNGYRALGWSGGGVLEPGALADMVTVALDSVRLAGAEAETAMASIVFAASAADVTDLVVAGEVVVHDRAHVSVDVANELAEAVRLVTS